MISRKPAHTRTWVLGVAALLIATVVVSVLWQTRAWQRSGKQASAEPSHSTAGIDDPRALGRQARQAVADGHFAEAFDLYRRLNAPLWTADDCFTIGSALLRRDRIVPGWAALEAARRLDPKHGETLRAIDSLQGKVASANGSERVRLHEAARGVEFLRNIPKGPPLGLLALGLARFAPDTDHEEEFLARIGVRDRTVLRGVNSIVIATNLVAQLLLEAGRASEAYELLDSCISKGTTDSNVVDDLPTSEREAAWLLSRAALQLDRNKVADAMLVLAADFGKRTTLSPEPAPFVGSKQCAECHGKIYHQQQDESRHALTLRLGTGLKDVPLPTHPVPDPVSPGITHAFVRKGEDRIEMESRAASQAVRAIVEYAVGSGRHGITMIAKDMQGTERELRVSYFAEKSSWGETKGIDFPPRDAAEHIGVPLTTGTLHRCLSCHTTWARAVDLSRPGPRGPEAEDRGIGCERCHGPGLNHVKAARSGFADMAIALGPNAPSPLRLKSCVECHAADGSVQPSDPEFTRAQGTTFLFSRCFTASKDRFGCTTCHDPHRPVETAAAFYESKCLLCHGAMAAKGGAQPTAKVDHGTGPTLSRMCRVNPADGCITCHMPKVEDPSRRSSFTDHHIRVHRTPARAHAVSPRPAGTRQADSLRPLSLDRRTAMIKEEPGPS
jgi:Cytochrome c554 and c-prime